MRTQSKSFLKAVVILDSAATKVMNRLNRFDAVQGFNHGTCLALLLDDLLEYGVDYT